MLSPAKALRYECLAAPVISGSSGDTSEGGQNGAEGTRCQKRSLGNGYTLDLTETIPHVVKDGHKLVRNCSTGKTVYWVCRKRKYGCPKYVHTDSAGTFIKKELGEHNHEPNQNPSPSPDNQTSENASNEDGSAEHTPKTEKSGKNNAASSKSSNLLRSTSNNENENTSENAAETTKDGANDERKPIDCANLVVSSVLAKAMSASATSSALFNNNNNNNDQTLHSMNGRKKGVDEFLNGGGSNNTRKRKLMDDSSNPFSEQSFDDSVLDLSNAKDNVYQTLHQDSTGSKSHNTISLNSNNQLNALSFPCTNFQHIYHKFTKAIKAINCAGRKFRRLDPATSEGLLSWRCSEKFCRYTLYTDGAVTKILKDGGKHNHELEGATMETSAPPVSEPIEAAAPVRTPAVATVLPEIPPQCATNLIPPHLQQPLLPPLLPTANDIAAVLAETNHLERLLKYQPADLLALMAKFTTDPTSFFNINHAAILPQIPPSISPLAAMPQPTLSSLSGVSASRDIRERSVSPASGSSQSRVILKRKQGAQGVNGEAVSSSLDSNNHVEPFLGTSQTSASVVASEILDFSKQSEPVDIMGDDDGRNSIDLTTKNNNPVHDMDDSGAIAPCSYVVDSIKASSKNSAVTSNGSATGGSSESDGESSQPPNAATPTPLPEMPDIIRKEFSVINAPDGRNHILQEGHIFSKDKCSSKSVYWRCKKKLCFAIMHTDLDMTRVTFRRGEHNHEPDPKIEQRARKGHFAKMPRKPRRRRVEIEAEAAAARALSASKKNKNKDDVTNTNPPPISPIASVDGADCSMIQSTNMFNNNTDETPMESSDTAVIFTSPSSDQGLEDLALLSSLTGTSSGSSSSDSVTDDLLAILSEAASELKDSTAISDLRDLLSSNLVADPSLLGQASGIGMTSPQDITTLAAAAAAAVVDSSGRILNPHALGRLNKRMINNVLSKFL